MRRPSRSSFYRRGTRDEKVLVYGLTTIRWILVIPAAILAWYVALVLGIFALEIRNSLCPSEYMVSGMCSGIFGKLTMDALTVLFSGISAFFVVTASALVAPAIKQIVAIAAFVVGAGVAAFFLIDADLEVWREFVSAILCGGVTCYILVRKFK